MKVCAFTLKHRVVQITRLDAKASSWRTKASNLGRYTERSSRRKNRNFSSMSRFSFSVLIVAREWWAETWITFRWALNAYVDENCSIETYSIRYLGRSRYRRNFFWLTTTAPSQKIGTPPVVESVSVRLFDELPAKHQASANSKETRQRTLDRYHELHRILQR